MNKKVKVVVSGMGRIAWQYHLPMIERDERFELIAISDPSAERQQEAREKYPQINTYSDFNAMLDAEKSADMAVIASPTTFHCQQSIAALEHNLAVFLEKPMCESLESAQKLADAVERLNGKLMLYQPHRARQETIALQKLVLDKLGKINHVRRTLSLFNRRNDWQSRKDCGGGMLNNYGAHYIDQFMYVFGHDAMTVKGSLLQRTVGIGDAEDLVNVLMQNSAGISCNLEINLGCAVPVNSWDIYGTLGCAHWDGQLDHWQLTYVKPGTLSEMTMQTTLAAQNRSYSLEGAIPWIKEEISLDLVKPLNYYDAVYDYFVNGQQPLVPLQETMTLMRVLNDCRNMAEGK